MRAPTPLRTSDFEGGEDEAGSDQDLYSVGEDSYYSSEEDSYYSSEEDGYYNDYSSSEEEASSDDDYWD